MSAAKNRLATGLHQGKASKFLLTPEQVIEDDGEVACARGGAAKVGPSGVDQSGLKLDLKRLSWERLEGELELAVELGGGAGEIIKYFWRTQYPSFYFFRGK